MTDASLLPDLISRSAARQPDAVALTYGKQSMSYGLLQQSISGFVSGVVGLGLQRGERIAIYLEKRLETVIASFGATAAGCVFVPLNPLLKADQVAYIMCDCNVRALITSPERLPLLASALPGSHDLRHVIAVSSEANTRQSRSTRRAKRGQPAASHRAGREPAMFSPLRAVLFVGSLQRFWARGCLANTSGVSISNRSSGRCIWHVEPMPPRAIDPGLEVTVTETCKPLVSVTNRPAGVRATLERRSSRYFVGLSLISRSSSPTRRPRWTKPCALRGALDLLSVFATRSRGRGVASQIRRTVGGRPLPQAGQRRGLCRREGSFRRSCDAGGVLAYMAPVVR
jgi:hypothetical protein